jgi:Ca2+:H+ antiporter
MWSKKKAIGILAISMIGIAIISEILVGSVEDTITHFDLSVLFVGAIVIGIVGNIPEKITSMMMARKGKLDLSLGIAVNSASQIALFVLPLIVIAAVIMGISFPLIFTPFELITMFAGTILLYFITQSGKGKLVPRCNTTRVFYSNSLRILFPKMTIPSTYCQKFDEYILIL